MNWECFDKILLTNHIYTINNNSNLNIVLFGSCHMSTIGFMLNKLLDNKYNIHIIISWFFEKNGIENFDMNVINNKIKQIIKISNVFIYHKHINDYGVDATILPNIVNDNCLKLMIPNYRFDYTNDNYSNSLHILEYNINNSDFPEFKFVIENYKNIIFFNTKDHPTHYLLFLQSLAIFYRILNTNDVIDVNRYYDNKCRNYFKTFNYIILPGKEDITDEISNKTGILKDADYFD